MSECTMNQHGEIPSQEDTEPEGISGVTHEYSLSGYPDKETC